MEGIDKMYIFILDSFALLLHASSSIQFSIQWWNQKIYLHKYFILFGIHFFKS